MKRRKPVVHLLRALVDGVVETWCEKAEAGLKWSLTLEDVTCGGCRKRKEEFLRD